MVNKWVNTKIDIPFFSIVVPVYNTEKYVKECIESVLQQTYSSWELILVDDGSTDSSGIICDNFCKDDRIKVIHQKNAGELNSRLNGMSVAKGKYVLGLDSDDYLDTNCLEIVKKAIDASGSELIFFGIRMVGDREGDIRCPLREGQYTQREILWAVIDDSNTSLCNKAIMLEKTREICFNEKIINDVRYNLDYALIVPILCNIETGYIIEDILYNYRIHGESATHQYAMQNIYDTEAVTEYVIQSLNKVSLLDEDLICRIEVIYLKTLVSKLCNLYFNGRINKEDCKNLHRAHIYKTSKKFESRKNLGFFSFVLLKAFRYRQYWILKLYSCWHRINQDANAYHKVCKS